VLQALPPRDAVASVSVLGSYAEYCAGSSGRADQVPERAELCSKPRPALLQGMTAHYLAYSTFPLKAGDTALVHAGAAAAWVCC